MQKTEYMKYIYRNIEADLLQWKNEKERFPLLVRGARQVGKSSVIRKFGEKFESFLEINFERDDAELNIKQVFEKGLLPKRICEELALIYNIPIAAGKTLLFFDEIQACIPAISSLRYFYEQIPDLHVIAAG